MEIETKEVYFDEYCPKCVHNDKREDEEPCDDCLAHGYNIHSHKPVRFEEGAKSEQTNSGKRTM